MGEKKCPGCLKEFDSSWTKIDGLYKCPACGGVHDMDALDFDSNDNRRKKMDEYKKIYRYLKDLHFKEAESDLRELRESNPKDAEVWFLSALARTCICYTPNDNKLNWKYDYIPTLNNINFENILESEFVKKALELSKPNQRECYLETFEYIEKVRKEIEGFYKNGDYKFDIFISTKVSKIDPKTKEPIKNEDGSIVRTKDYELASGLYDFIKDQIPGVKVFLSERCQGLFTGKKYEHIIFSALQSAKVFILVGENETNIQWPWVRNEWMRYLYLMNPEIQNRNKDQKRSFVFVTKTMNPNDVPYEFKNLQHIYLGKPGAETNLLEFIKDNVYDNSIKKIESKEFKSEVAEIGNVKITNMVQSTRKFTTYQKTDSTLQDEIDNYVYDIERNPDETPSKKDVIIRNRKNAFDELERIVYDHPDAYLAKKNLLLKDSNYYGIDDYFSKSENIYNSPSIAEKFFEMATESDSKKYILKCAKSLTKNIDCKYLSSPLKICICPYLGYIDNNILRDILNNIIKIMDKNKGINDNLIELMNQYLLLDQYLENNNSLKYISSRKRVIGWLSNIRLTKKMQKYSKQLLKEIIDVNKGEDEALWYFISINTTGKIYSVDNYISLLTNLDFGKIIEISEDTNDVDMISEIKRRKVLNIDNSDSDSEDLIDSFRLSIVQNEEMIDKYVNLFRYAPANKKPKYLEAFLLSIISDKRTYENSDGGLLLPSTGERDYELNGFDLFNKYITYSLDEKPIKKELIDRVQMDPYPKFYLYKESPMVIDLLLATFGAYLHKAKIFSSAKKLYSQYIAQQGNENSLDCLFAKYYIELTENRCSSQEEGKITEHPLNIASIKNALIRLQRNGNSLAKEFLDELLEMVDYQKKYYSSIFEIQKLIASLPERNVDNLRELISIVNRYDETIENSSYSQIKKDLGNRFDKKISGERSMILSLQNASKLFEIFDGYDIWDNFKKVCCERKDDLKKKSLKRNYSELRHVDECDIFSVEELKQFYSELKNQVELYDGANKDRDCSLLNGIKNNIDLVQKKVEKRHRKSNQKDMMEKTFSFIGFLFPVVGLLYFCLLTINGWRECSLSDGDPMFGYLQKCSNLDYFIFIISAIWMVIVGIIIYIKNGHWYEDRNKILSKKFLILMGIVFAYISLFSVIVFVRAFLCCLRGTDDGNDYDIVCILYGIGSFILLGVDMGLYYYRNEGQ